MSSQTIVAIERCACSRYSRSSPKTIDIFSAFMLSFKVTAKWQMCSVQALPLGGERSQEYANILRRFNTITLENYDTKQLPGQSDDHLLGIVQE